MQSIKCCPEDSRFFQLHLPYLSIFGNSSINHSTAMHNSYAPPQPERRRTTVTRHNKVPNPMMVSSKISLASVAQPGQVNPKRVNPEPRLRLQGPIHAIAKRCWLQHQCTRHAPVHGLLVLFWMLAPYPHRRLRDSFSSHRSRS